MNDISMQQGAKLISDLLAVIEQDPDREGLKDTPKRVIKFYEEFLSRPQFNFTVFSSEEMDEMVVQKDIPFYSLCEHHLLPFLGVGHIAYIPNGKIVGLSKLARALDYFSHDLQNQERITTQVAEFIQKKLDPLGVMVVISARHMCMEMRGVKKHDTYTITSKLLGVFKEDVDAKNEFLTYIKT